jgi:hypothetical protein
MGPFTIVFVINSLAGGGAEGTLVNLITTRGAKLREFRTHLVLLDLEDERYSAPT